MVADAGPTCPADDALSNAAATLLLAGNAPDSNTLVAAVREAGSDAVLVHALFQPHDDAAATQKWLAELRAVSDADLVCGEASGSAGRLLIASARAGSLLPLTAASSVVRGTLAPGFDHPELVISAADGTLTRLGLEPSMLHDGIPLQEDLARPAKIQLLARGHAGPRPIAERELPATRSRAHAIAALPPTAAGSSASTTAKDATANDLAALLVIRLNSLRAERERLAVRDNRLLATLATAHARAVCQAGKLAHELSPGQDPEARVEQAGIRARLVGETIARAGDAGSAFAELGESPSHLLTLLEPRFTDVGVGVAHDSESRSCVVVLLAAWPRYVGR
ncbi:MAG TPA: CAP domain-containing protein [Polyangiales bacterium]|nr:CAP domain-containing protein [Polyangiales bacterium]